MPLKYRTSAVSVRTVRPTHTEITLKALPISPVQKRTKATVVASGTRSLAETTVKRLLQWEILRDTPNARNKANWTCFYFISFSAGRYEHIARGCSARG